VCDFGLARKLDPNETRQSTNIVGTPAYMPPEQARGESVDERADVYSLGATLYEMLVGRSPFHASTTWDTLFQVMTADPVSIRKLNSSIPLDLETICAKCIAKAVDHRYQTAGALADDLQCFLDNRPIAARRVSQFEVFRRWCLRNRALAGSLLVGVVLATALLIGSVVAAVRFQRQNERLVRTLETSIEAADQLLISVTEDSQLLPKSPGSQNVSRRLLQRARRYYSAFLEENQNDPRLRFQLARTHAGLVLVAGRMDELETVETEAAAALKLLDDLEQSDGRNQKTLLLRANVLHSHAAAMQSAGRFKDALQLSRQANALCEVAETAEPKRSEVLSLSAKVLVGLANSNQSLGDNQKSVDLLEQANERYSTLVESEPDSSAHRLAAARVQHNLGNSKQAEGFEVMSRHYHSSIDLLQQLPDDERQAVAVRAQLATSSMNLGMAYSGLNDNDSAAQNYGFAIKEFQRLVELEPVVNRHKYLYAVAVLNSGNIDNQLQNFERLASRCQEVIPVVEKLIEAEPENFGHVELKAMLSDNVAHALRRLGNVDQAIVALKESEGLFQDLAEAADWAPESMYSLALNQYMLAQSYSELGNIQDALNVLAKARSTTKRGLSKDKAQADLRVHELDLAVLETEILEQQEPVPTEKIIMLADAGLSLANTLGKDLDDYLIDRNTAVLLLTKANCQFTQKQFEESASQARLAIEKLEATFQTPYESDVRELFGEAYLHLGRVARILLQSDSGNADLQARFDAAMAAAEGFGVSEKAIESLRIDE
ncbi:MAG: protein kinase, partial [Planctomycetaceae bacterium]